MAALTLPLKVLPLLRLAAKHYGQLKHSHQMVFVLKVVLIDMKRGC